MLNDETLKEVKKLHQQALDKLNESLEGTMDMTPGQMPNAMAPCLIRSAIYDIIMLLHVINKAEAK
jgi:hypothetical protein